MWNLLWFASYLCFLTFVVGLIFIVFLVTRFPKQKGIPYLVALIFSFCWIEFYMYALSSQAILNMPFLYRSAFPFRFLLGPLLYTYVATFLNPNKSTSKWHLLHFAFPLVMTVLLIPEFTMSSTEKIKIFEAFYSKNDIYLNKPTGILPAGVIQPLNFIYLLLYCFGTLGYIFLFLKNQRTAFHEKNRIAIKWIWIVSSVVTFFIFLQLFQYLALKIDKHFNVIMQMMQSLSLIGLKTYLVFEPRSANCMQGCNEVSFDINELLPVPKSGTKYQQYVKQINDFWSDKKSYLKSDFTITEMALECNLSKAKLSEIISELYGIKFNELVNRYRIYHFLTLMKKEEGRQLKMETILKQSGFQYRSTFYNAFRKITGTHPNAYLKLQ